MRGILVLILVGLVVSCTGVKKPEKPKNLISQTKMIDILTEAYLSNAARSISSKDIRDKGLQLDSIIFKKYQIDSLQFARSNEYYAADLNVYAAIFTKVETKLVAVKATADSLKRNDKKMRSTPDLDTIDGKPMLAEPLITTDDQEDIE